MAKISDCSCECRDKGKEKEIEERALSSINKILGTEGQAYYPDGTGAVTIPIADADQLTQIGTNAEDIAALEKAQEKTETDIGQMKISITENAGEIEKIQAVNDAQAREIAAIKTDDGSRDTEIAGLKTRVTATEGDISDIQTVDAGQTSEINALKGKTNQQATQISGLDALCESITRSLVTDVEVGVGTDAGSFIVSVVEEDGTKRSSDSFQYGRVGTFALMQGAQAGYVKGVLTLVDGTTVESNDFQILQVTASDIYVTSITLSADYQTGKIGGTIGYSNGNSAAINEILVPTAPGVTSNISDLLSRMTAVETKDRSQDASISDLTTRVETLEATPGIGKFTNTALGTIQGSTADGKISAGSDGTGSVNGWSTIKSDIASKASQSALATTNAEVATKASKTELMTLQSSMQDCFKEIEYDSASGTLTLTALDGQSDGVTIDRNWGSANAGKVLGIGSDGMVEPVDGSSSKEWTEITSFSSISKSKITINTEILISSGRTTDSSYHVDSCYCHCIYNNASIGFAGFTSSGYAYDSKSNYPIVDFTVTDNGLNFGILKNNTRIEINISDFRLYIHY